MNNENDRQNIDEAHKLLIEALAEDPGVRECVFNQSLFVVEKNKKFAEFFCKCLNQALNFEWKTSVLKNPNSQNYFESKNRFEASLFNWSYKIRDPKYFLEIFAHPDHVANLACWTHPSIQSMIAQLKNTQTDEESRKIFDSAKNLLDEEQPMIPLFYSKLPSFCHSEAVEQCKSVITVALQSIFFILALHVG